MKRELLEDLIMFKSVKEDKYITLKEYISSMKDGQKYIYYGTAETESAVKALPQSEKILELGYDILCFTEQVDEFAVKMLGKYDDKEFKNILGEDLGLGGEEAQNEEDKELLSAIKEALGDKVAKVKASTVLKTHPVCLSSEGEISIEMEKVLSKMPNAKEGVKANKVLEINANHKVFEKLKAVYAEDKEKIADYAEILYGLARLISGLSVEEPTELTDKIFNLLS